MPIYVQYRHHLLPISQKHEQMSQQESRGSRHQTLKVMGRMQQPVGVPCMLWLSSKDQSILDLEFLLSVVVKSCEPSV